MDVTTKRMKRMKRIRFHSAMVPLALAIVLIMTIIVPLSTDEAYAGSKKSGNCYAKKIELKNYETGKVYKLTPKFSKKKTKYTTAYPFKHGSKLPKLTIWRDHKKAKIYRWDNTFGWSYIKGSKYVVEAANFGTYKFKIKAQNGKSKIYRITVKDSLLG